MVMLSMVGETAGTAGKQGEPTLSRREGFAAKEVGEVKCGLTGGIW